MTPIVLRLVFGCCERSERFSCFVTICYNLFVAFVFVYWYYVSTVNYDRVYIRSCMMFTSKELVVIAQSLILNSKSVSRLAAKEGQPDGVVAEFRKVAVFIDDLLKKVNAELVKIDAVKK